MSRWLATCLATLVMLLSLTQAAGGGNGWRQLYRPLHLPHLVPGGACPVSRVDQRVDWASVHAFGGYGIGRGPVYPVTGSAAELAVRPDAQDGGPWLTTKVFWWVSPKYRGPALIRGRQLDGRHRLGFNGRELPRAALRIHTYGGVGWTGMPAGSRGYPSSIRALVPGCYGVQIDGTGFSRIVIFRVTD